MKINPEEFRFISVLRQIMNQQSIRTNRTGMKTKNVFSPPELRFSLLDNRFPLLTTRRLPLRHIFEELMWFIRGQTDVSILRNKSVHVWDMNSSRNFLDSNGLAHFPEWEIGKSYGYQFRTFGGHYDQLEQAIRLLKTDPTSRRILINLWNPSELNCMALPPCLFCYQFYVENGEYLVCKATQRSSDISLAGGWNIATVSLFTIMMANVCGLKPKEIIWSVGDAHIYLNQLNGVEEQLKRDPRPFPTLSIVKSPKNNDITTFEYNHFRLNDYMPYPKIKLEMN